MSGIDWEDAISKGARRLAELAQRPDEQLRRERDRLDADLGRLLDAVQDVALLSYLMPTHTHHLQGARQPDCPGCAIDKLVKVHRGVRALRESGQR